MQRMVLFILLLLFGISHVMAKNLIIDKVPISQNFIALTLEDVEDKISLEKIIQICQNENIRVTLFCPGQFVQNEQEGIRRIISLGCEVGICGVKYQPWDELREEEIWREYQLAKRMLSPKTGQDIWLVRPPYEYYDARVLKALEPSGEIIFVRGASMGSKISAGDIINIKMNKEISLKKLQKTIMQLKMQGYKIETVLNLLKKNNQYASSINS